LVRRDDKTRRYFVGSPAGLCSLGSGRGVLNSSGLITRGAKKGFGMPHKKPAGEGATPTGYSGASTDGGQTIQPDNAGNDRRFQSQSATGGLNCRPDVLVRGSNPKLCRYLCPRVHLRWFCQCQCQESPAPTPKPRDHPVDMERSIHEIIPECSGHDEMQKITAPNRLSPTFNIRFLMEN
jgi:hypothetical protein